MSYRLVPKSMTLALILRHFAESDSFRGHCVEVVEDM